MIWLFPQADNSTHRMTCSHVDIINVEVVCFCSCCFILLDLDTATQTFVFIVKLQKQYSSPHKNNSN